MFNSISKVLVLAPHTDDGELGAGGTIARLIEQNIKVYYAAFSTAGESVIEGFPKDILKTEVRKATSVLGIPQENLFVYDYPVRKLNYQRQEILDNLVELRNSINPDLILTPSLSDVHQDHATIASETIRAFKNKSILGYDLIWNTLVSNARCFVSLEEKHLNAKVNALRQYSSQQHRNYMSEEFIFSLARTRGVQVGTQYAEAFETIRWVM